MLLAPSPLALLTCRHGSPFRSWLGGWQSGRDNSPSVAALKIGQNGRRGTGNDGKRIRGRLAVPAAFAGERPAEAGPALGS
jgi:hypothetical protein